MLKVLVIELGEGRPRRKYGKRTVMYYNIRVVIMVSFRRYKVIINMSIGSDLKEKREIWDLGIKPMKIW